MTFLPESTRAAVDSFGVASAAFVALLAAIVIVGLLGYVIQEIRLKRRAANGR